MGLTWGLALLSHLRRRGGGAAIGQDPIPCEERIILPMRRIQGRQEPDKALRPGGSPSLRGGLRHHHPKPSQKTDTSPRLSSAFFPAPRMVIHSARPSSDGKSLSSSYHQLDKRFFVHQISCASHALDSSRIRVSLQLPCTLAVAGKSIQFIKLCCQLSSGKACFDTPQRW